VATWSLADGQVFKTIPISHTPSEMGDYAKGEWVAADAGEVFAKQVGGTSEVAGGCGVDYFDVMAFPVHLAATDRPRAYLGEGVEIGDGKPEGRIGYDRFTKRLDDDGDVRGLLCLAIEGGGPDVGCDHPTVVLDRRTSRGRLFTGGVGPFQVAMHDSQVALET
jgi:hypothetical protein